MSNAVAVGRSRRPLGHSQVQRPVGKGRIDCVVDVLVQGADIVEVTHHQHQVVWADGLGLPSNDLGDGSGLSLTF